MKKEQGITLIALIITIIVLLILAGVTINLTIGERGIFKTAQNAQEEHIKSQLKEELELAILDIKTDKMTKGQEMKREDLVELGNIGAIMENYGIPAEGEYKDYYFEVDENYVVTIIGKLKGEKPIITYALDTEKVGVTEVTITVNASVKEGNIEKIIKPDGTHENAEQVTYKVTKSGSYVFQAVASTGRKASITVKVRNIKPKMPVISVIQVGGYPTFTSSGVKEAGGSIVEIEYDNDEIFKKYYSEDGTNWKLYTGRITTYATNIMAKSVIESETKLESEIAKTIIDIPNDILRQEAYDKNLDTYAYYDNFSSPIPVIGSGNGYSSKFYIDKSCWGKQLNIDIKLYNSIGYYRILPIAFIDEKDNIISTYKTNRIETGVINHVTTFQIPENTKSIIIYSDLDLTIYEVAIFNNLTLEYPIITSSGIKNIKRVDNNNVYYELDLTLGECYGPGAAPRTLYDGDRNTNINYKHNNWGTNGIFLIDSSAVGKNVSISFTGGNPYIVAYRDFRSAGLNVNPDEDGIAIEMNPYVISQGYANNIVITPEMKYISIWSGSGALIASEVYL